MACIIDCWAPTASMTECRAEPVGEVFDLGHPLVTALFDEPGWVLEGELLGGPAGRTARSRVVR